jgi:hypothetical protein
VLDRTGSPPIPLEVRFELLFPRGVLLDAFLLLDARLDPLLDVLVWVEDRLGGRLRSALHEGFVTVEACLLGEVDNRLQRVKKEGVPSETFTCLDLLEFVRDNLPSLLRSFFLHLLDLRVGSINSLLKSIVLAAVSHLKWDF